MRVLGMLPDILPRQIRSQSVDLLSVMSNQKDEVFSREISGSPPRGQGTRLNNLRGQPNLATKSL